MGKEPEYTICPQCAGIGWYQMFDRPEPGWARRCYRCNGTGLVAVLAAKKES